MITIHPNGYSHPSCGDFVHKLVNFERRTCGDQRYLSKEDLVILSISFKWKSDIHTPTWYCIDNG